MGSNNIFNSFHRTNYIKKIELSKISKIIINYLRDPKKNMQQQQQQFTNYKVLSWYVYQSTTPRDLQSIEHFHKTCQEQAKLYPDDIIVLCQNAIAIGEDRCVNGMCASTAISDGFINVRTRKKYWVYGTFVTPVEPENTTARFGPFL